MEVVEAKTAVVREEEDEGVGAEVGVGGRRSSGARHCTMISTSSSRLRGSGRESVVGVLIPEEEDADALELMASSFVIVTFR